MHVVQTPGPPPNQGRINLPISGWIWKSRNAPVKIVSAYAAMPADSLKIQSPAPETKSDKSGGWCVWRKMPALLLNIDGLVQRRAEPQGGKASLGLRRQRGSGNAAIDADTQAEQPRKHEQVGVQGPEDHAEQNYLGDEISQQERIDAPVNRKTELIIPVQNPHGRRQKPDEANHPKYPKGDNHGQRTIVKVAV